jgi:DNA-binding MltR family transcriptional regulator
MKIKKPDRRLDYKSLAVNKEVNDELVNSSDRVAALIGATILDVQLERLISSFLIDDAEEVKQLLSIENQSAPLSSLAARARAAYCLGLISKEEYKDISTVRDIRNIFAHHIFDCNFHNEKIKAACENFLIFTYLIPEEIPGSPRVRFNIVIGTLESLLRFRAEHVNQRQRANAFARANSGIPTVIFP